MTLLLGLVGGGWISGQHLEALERLGRSQLVGVVTGTPETGEAVTARWGGTRFDDVDTMLMMAKLDAVYVAVPPHRAVPICEKLVAAGIPFLTEKPLSAEPDGPVRLAAAIEAADLVVGVGYHLRALDIMAEVRERLAAAPPQMVVARWLDTTPKPAWWRKVGEGGGQVVEQSTHLYDLARLIVGEATVVGAASTRIGPPQPDVDVADSTAAVLRFENGAIGSFANSRRINSAVIQVEFVSDGLITTLEKRSERGQRDWYARFDDGASVRSIRVMADPYETQASVFFDAVEARDPRRVLSTYADALRTDRLTRAVVAATGVPG